MQHDGVEKASQYDQENLWSDVRAFLFAHLVLFAEKIRLAEQNAPCTNKAAFQSLNKSFFEEVQYSCKPCRLQTLFILISCLIEWENVECFPIVQAKYFTQNPNLYL